MNIQNLENGIGGGDDKVVLITGGAGFIGSHLALAILEQDRSQEVWIVDDLSRGSKMAVNALQDIGGSRVKIFCIDLGDIAGITSFLHSGKNRIRYVFHLAAISFVPESMKFPDLYFQNITRNTQLLLSALESTQRSVYFYFASSCSVYGSRPTAPVTEATSLNPISPYGKAKMHAEKAIADAVKRVKGEVGRTFKARIFRFFNVIGADKNGRLGEFTRDDLSAYARLWTVCREVALGHRTHISIRGGRLPTFDGTPERDFIHVSDVVSGIRLAWQQDDKGWSASKDSENTKNEDALVLNLGGGRPISVMEFVHACRKVTGKFLVVKFEQSNPSEAISLYSDITKAQRLLGWMPAHTNLTSSLQDAWRFTLQQQLDAKQRAAFYQQDWTKERFDVCVVGAGLSGSVAAERILNMTTKTVVLLEKRDHIGGNVYDYIEKDTGIRVSLYGIHLFHTKKKWIWDYLQRFSAWRPYEHRVVGWVGKQWVPIPVNIETVNTLFNLSIHNATEMGAWLKGEQIQPTGHQLLKPTSETVALSRVGQRLYDLIFKPYTIKQWEKTPKELGPAVLARIPVRSNHDDRYFTDEYQAYPLHGYTRIFEHIYGLHPDRLKVVLNANYFHFKDKLLCEDIIYTGPVDAYYAQSGYPKLEYRSLTFDRRVFNTSGYVFPKAQNNFPSLEYNFTRVVEYKHIFEQQSNLTSVFYEYSSSEGEPYYPIPNKRNLDLFDQYQQMAMAENHTWFIGRLANYKYYNMDDAIDAALKTTALFLDKRYVSEVKKDGAVGEVFDKHLVSEVKKDGAAGNGLDMFFLAFITNEKAGYDTLALGEALAARGGTVIKLRGNTKDFLKPADEADAKRVYSEIDSVCPHCTHVYVDTQTVLWIAGAIVAYQPRRLITILGFTSKTVTCKKGRYHFFVSLMQARKADVLIVETVSYMHVCPAELREKMLLMPHFVNYSSIHVKDQRAAVVERWTHPPRAPPYIFTGGMSNRDFKTVLAASSLEKVQLRIGSGGKPVNGCSNETLCTVLPRLARPDFIGEMQGALLVAMPQYAGGKAAAGSTAIHEGMTQSKLIVTTKVRPGFCTGLIKNGYNGFFVNPGDVNGWRAIIKDLFNTFRDNTSAMMRYELNVIDFSEDWLSIDAVLRRLRCELMSRRTESPYIRKEWQTSDPTKLYHMSIRCQQSEQILRRHGMW